MSCFMVILTDEPAIRRDQFNIMASSPVNLS